jgi:hypothetical protein
MADENELDERSRRALVAHIDECLNGDLKGEARTIGFGLLTFHYGQAGAGCHFDCTGATVADIVRLMRETADKFEAMDDVRGHG